MIFYLDNWMSHTGSINENFGRELLELFSMGVGKDGQPNYTEDDVKECARAFTGWTYTGHIPRYPYGRYAQQAILESAYSSYRAGETATAVAACDRFIRTFPNHPSVDYAHYLKGLVNFREDQGLLGYVYELDLSERDPKAMR